MEAKHTPGPWMNSNGTILAPAGKVAEAGNPGYDGFAAESEDEAIANARLIAAAPDLLAALRKALEWVEHVQSVAWDSIPEGMRGDNGAAWAIRSAIARATGGGK